MGTKWHLTFVAALMVAPFVGSGIARSEPTPSPTPKPTPSFTAGVLQNSYFAHAGDSTLADGVVRIVNNTAPSLCALIYVTDKDQEMKECCGFPISDKGTLIFSVNNDLTSNPANGVATTDGSIAIMSSNSSACNPAQPQPTPQLQAWATHSQTGGFVTEGEFTALPMTKPALADLTAECAAIQLIGSGKGICRRATDLRE